MVLLVSTTYALTPPQVRVYFSVLILTKLCLCVKGQETANRTMFDPGGFGKDGCRPCFSCPIQGFPVNCSWALFFGLPFWLWVQFDGQFILVFSISCSSPVIGSILTSIDDARLAIGKGPIVFIKPTLRHCGLLTVLYACWQSTDLLTPVQGRIQWYHNGLASRLSFTFRLTVDLL